MLNNEQRLLTPFHAGMLRMCNISCVTVCQPFMAVPRCKSLSRYDNYNVSWNILSSHAGQYFFGGVEAHSEAEKNKQRAQEKQNTHEVTRGCLFVLHPPLLKPRAYLWTEIPLLSMSWRIFLHSPYCDVEDSRDRDCPKFCGSL